MTVKTVWGQLGLDKAKGTIGMKQVLPYFFIGCRVEDWSCV